MHNYKIHNNIEYDKMDLDRGEKMMKVIDFLGSRIVKTGVAVFLTAITCYGMNWPPVFAVITAIVTLEPTVSDSIRKGIVRFPASVIGSAYAVLFIVLFGNSPITYTLAAVLTIATCFKLNLHAGLLVATLTSVTMIEVVESNYFFAFLTRLGTTSIGLLVSTGVNMFILPADYREDITENIYSIRKTAGILLNKIILHIFTIEDNKNNIGNSLINKLYKKITNTETLIRFQNDESKYHPLIGKEKRQFIKAEAQLSSLRMLHYHLENLNRMSTQPMSWTKAERNLIMAAVTELRSGLLNSKDYHPKEHHEQLISFFWQKDEKIREKSEVHPTIVPPRLIVLYELIAVYDIVDRLYTKENNHKLSNAQS